MFKIKLVVRVVRSGRMLCGYTREVTLPFIPSVGMYIVQDNRKSIWKTTTGRNCTPPIRAVAYDTDNNISVALFEVDEFLASSSWIELQFNEFDQNSNELKYFSIIDLKAALKIDASASSSTSRIKDSDRIGSIDAYRIAEKEWNLYNTAAGCVWELKRATEEFESEGGHVERIRRSILRQALDYMATLRELDDWYEELLSAFAEKALSDRHGITIGDKVPFSHYNESGHLRLEGVNIHLNDGDNQPRFYLTGSRYKKDGKVGKRKELTTLPLHLKEK